MRSEYYYPDFRQLIRQLEPMESSLEKLKSMFSNMAKNGWDTNSPMKWGFFFFDKEKDKLYAVFAELEESGYTLEDIYQTEINDNYWILNATKIDTLTPEKLHKRNLAFNKLADYCEIAYYDGWDVERIK